MKSGKYGNEKLGWLNSARKGWAHNGDQRPPFAVETKKGQRSVWDFPRPPIIEKVAEQVLIVYQDQTIANSHNVLAVLETASPPTYYIPKHDIDMGMLKGIPEKTSLCEWKGSATYYALKDNINLPVAWSYADPYIEFQDLKSHLGFYPQNLDCYVGGVQVKSQPGRFYAGWVTPDLVGPFKGEPGTGHW